MVREPKKRNNDPEFLLSLDRGYLTPAERQDIAKYTLETRGGICYNANLQGKLSTICAGIKKAAPGYRFHLSDYPFHRITYTVSGQAQLHDGKEHHTINSGSVYYFAPRASGIVVNKGEGPWTHIYIHFTGSEAPALFHKITALSKRVLNIPNPMEIQGLFEGIARNCIEQGEHSQTICDCFLRILLLKLATQAATGHAYQNASRISYIRCYNYIQEHFSDIQSIQDIADACFINKVYLCRIFKRYTSETPMAYVTKLKMNKAALLLMNTNHSIKQISMMLGFENQYYFSRAFKKAYGLSPLFYRQKYCT